jgi:retinol dehydrogenase 12
MTTYLITGTNTGIGRTTAEALAAHGGRIICTARSREKAMPVIDGIRKRSPNAEVEFLALDLADLHSVQSAAATVVASGRPLDVLINNAGVAGAEGTTKDGFQLTFGTNHVGHFALTEMLLPLLLAAPQGRIVNVSSEAHRRVTGIDFDAVRRPSVRSEGYAAYAVSKLANILHAKELARRLTGTRVTTYALHPGVVATEIWRELPGWMQALMKLFMTSPKKGAATTVYCATAPELATVSGRYYDRLHETEPSALANDEALAKELYAWSDSAIAGVLGSSWRDLVKPGKPVPT